MNTVVVKIEDLVMDELSYPVNQIQNHHNSEIMMKMELNKSKNKKIISR